MRHGISGPSSGGIPDRGGREFEPTPMVAPVPPLEVVEQEPSSRIRRDEREDRRLLRRWWHDVLRMHDRYACFATLLALTMDKELARYLAESGSELDQISGTECLVIVLSETEVRRSGVDKELWPAVMEEHIQDGYSIRIAKLFDISCEQFPSLVLFRDIRSPEHILVTLKGMSAEEIADRMRSVFSTIQRAVSNGEDPLTALERRRNQEIFRQRGRTLVSHISSIAERTFETAMEAWIKAQIDK
jgi:hypothetical protein